jgi:hypothetical protein
LFRSQHPAQPFRNLGGYCAIMDRVDLKRAILHVAFHRMLPNMPTVGLTNCSRHVENLSSRNNLEYLPAGTIWPSNCAEIIAQKNPSGVV